MENNIMMPNESTLKKVFGDPLDEGAESLYRLAATLLVNATEVEGIDRLGDDNALRTLLNKNEQVGEAVISFVIAAILELFPMSMLDDERRRLAYNLRVRTYEKIEELLFRATPFVVYVQDEAERAMLIAKGEKVEGLIERGMRWAKSERKKSGNAVAISPAKTAGDGHESSKDNPKSKRTTTKSSQLATK
jgi:hypothetical protein